MQIGKQLIILYRGIHTYILNSQYLRCGVTMICPQLQDIVGQLDVPEGLRNMGAKMQPLLDSLSKAAMTEYVSEGFTLIDYALIKVAWCLTWPMQCHLPQWRGHLHIEPNCLALQYRSLMKTAISGKDNQVLAARLNTKLEKGAYIKYGAPPKYNGQLVVSSVASVANKLWRVRNKYMTSPLMLIVKMRLDSYWKQFPHPIKSFLTVDVRRSTRNLRQMLWFPRHFEFFQVTFAWSEQVTNCVASDSNPYLPGKWIPLFLPCF